MEKKFRMMNLSLYLSRASIILIESVNRRHPATNYARSGRDVYHPNEFRSRRGNAARGTRDSDGQNLVVKMFVQGVDTTGAPRVEASLQASLIRTSASLSFPLFIAIPFNVKPKAPPGCSVLSSNGDGSPIPLDCISTVEKLLDPCG